MAKFCSSCGASLEDDAKFCEKCGAAQTVGQSDNNRPTQIQLARKWRFPNLIFDEVVYIDDVKVGALSNGQTKIFEVAPGTHKLQLKMTYPLLSCFFRSRPMDIHINKGDTLKFNCDFIFGKFAAMTGFAFFIALFNGFNAIKIEPANN